MIQPAPDLEKITIQPSLTFDALVAGEPGAPLVLLHDFAESMHTWRGQVSALAGAGYRAVAPSQRGYSSIASLTPPGPSPIPAPRWSP
jgi:pimeloyl-ACP methyl ester carboxylesterase